MAIVERVFLLLMVLLCGQYDHTIFLLLFSSLPLMEPKPYFTGMSDLNHMSLYLNHYYLPDPYQSSVVFFIFHIAMVISLAYLTHIYFERAIFRHICPPNLQFFLFFFKLLPSIHWGLHEAGFCSSLLREYVTWLLGKIATSGLSVYQK